MRTGSWAHLLGMGAYFAYLAARLPRIINALYWNSDLAFASVLVTDLAAHPGPGVVKVGPAPHYSTIWYLFATETLPFRRHIWEMTPFLLALAGVGLLSWACWKVSGSVWAASLSFVIGMSANTPVAATTLPEGLRSHTWLNSFLLLALGVWALTRSGGPAKKQIGVLVIGMGVLSGVTLASDPLFVVSGLVPFLAASAGVWLYTRRGDARRLMHMAAGITAVAPITAVSTVVAMDRLGFSRFRTKDGVTALPDMLNNFRSLGANVLYLTNASFLRQPSLLETAASALVAICLAILVVSFGRFLFRLLRSRNGDVPTRNPALAFYSLFWSITVAVLGASWVITDFATGRGLLVSRYGVPFVFAVAGVAPLVAAQSSRRRFVAGVAVLAFSFLSISSLMQLLSLEKHPLVESLSKAGKFLEREGLIKGYSAYWNSHSLTYHTDFSVRVLPVFRCIGGPERNLCPFWINSRSTWYEPSPGQRSFIIAGRSLGETLDPPSRAIFGPPEAVQSFGDIDVFVFPYDVASRIRDPELDPNSR